MAWRVLPDLAPPVSRGSVWMPPPVFRSPRRNMPGVNRLRRWTMKRGKGTPRVPFGGTVTDIGPLYADTAGVPRGPALLRPPSPAGRRRSQREPLDDVRQPVRIGVWKPMLLRELRHF